MFKNQSDMFRLRSECKMLDLWQKHVNMIFLKSLFLLHSARSDSKLFTNLRKG